MKKEYDTLRRRPFLTPIWLAGLASLVAIAFAAWLWATATSTTVVLVRHAEKQLDAGDDPNLTPVGEARAALLARMFGERAVLGGLDAIYVSPTRRSHQTAAPLSARLQLAVTEGPEEDVRRLTRQVLREHQGGRVLIVAHSNTIPGIVEILADARKVPEIGDNEYGTMYILTVPRIGHSNVLRMTY